MTKKDFYEVLGVSKSASATEIKSAYRNMAKKCHPDLHPNDKQAEVQFKEITEAYEVLSDSQKKAAYDQYGHAAFEGGASGFGGNPFAGGFSGGFGGGFSDFFEEVFNGFMGGRARPQENDMRIRGNDVRYDLTISLKEAFSGVKKKIDINTFVPCEKCAGKGGENIEKCSTCGGSGRVRRQNGFFMMESACPACNGSGHVITKPCSECRGTGRIKQKQTLEVSVPAGVDTGVRMRLAGKGEAGLNGGENGDLYIFITVEEGKLFTRHETNLYCSVPISMTMATLGGSIQIPTIDGGSEKETIKIHAGTQSGTQVKIKGRGMPVMRGSARGDLYVTLNVEIPTNLTKRQKELLEEFDAEDTGKSTPKTSTFWENIKKIFEDFV
ncbi:MAG: molecular chaperone DnaJ [Alphaproteobacteria bacterium]|nr:molecular chaperone DnaJ [Alphaproteobacteria bacterium]